MIFVTDRLGGGFKNFYFHPYLGKIPILTNIFQLGWNHQPVFVTDTPSESLTARPWTMVGMEDDPASYWVSATFFSGATCQIDDIVFTDWW